MLTDSILRERKKVATVSKKARIGFIGAGGFVSSHHLLTARDSQNMEIVAIADLNEQLLNKHQSRLSLRYTTTDYKKILSDPEIDIAVIGTKQDIHARLIVESLDAGKWVFCEKPMAENEQDCQAVLAAEKRNAGKLAIGFNRRFAPAYKLTKDLMKNVPRPWFMNYRLMMPGPDKGPDSYYGEEPKILYEGCHILDLICWMYEDRPCRVYMTGDRLRNNCVVLSFKDGSQVSFMCGSMGTLAFWKEYMELFSNYHAIAVSDFIDMRVRGFENQHDRIFAPENGMYKDEIMRSGFDMYEMILSNKIYERYDLISKMGPDSEEMIGEHVCRPTLGDNGPIPEYKTDDPVFLRPDKGWKNSFIAFAQAFLDGTGPGNANGKAGALTTELAMALLDSLEKSKPVDF